MKKYIVMLIIAFLLSFGAPSLVKAAIYKWADKNGVVHYSETPVRTDDEDGIENISGGENESLIKRHRTEKSRGYVIPITGTGAKASKMFELSQGLNIFHFDGMGKGYYEVDLLDKDGDPIVSFSANDPGEHHSSKAIRIEHGGRYLLNVKTEGFWRIRIVKPQLPEIEKMEAPQFAHDDVELYKDGCDALELLAEYIDSNYEPSRHEMIELDNEVAKLSAFYDSFRDGSVSPEVNKNYEGLKYSAKFNYENMKRAAESGEYSRTVYWRMKYLQDTGKSLKLLCDSMIEKHNIVIE